METKSYNGFVELKLETDVSSQQILDQLMEQGVEINRFEVTTPSLNEIFLELAGTDYE